MKAIALALSLLGASVAVLPSPPPQVTLPTVSGTIIVPRCFPSAEKIHTPPGPAL